MTPVHVIPNAVLILGEVLSPQCSFFKFFFFFFFLKRNEAIPVVEVTQSPAKVHKNSRFILHPLNPCIFSTG